MEWCSLTGLKDGTLWQKDGGGQHSGSCNLYCVCTCSHERIGDHPTKLKGWWLKWDCINAPYAVSLYMFLYMLLIYVFLCDFFCLHFSCENKIELTRQCRKTPLTEFFLICKNQINKTETPTKLHLIKYNLLGRCNMGTLFPLCPLMWLH